MPAMRRCSKKPDCGHLLAIPGQCFESLDCPYIDEKDCRECVKLKEVVNTLPENTRWRELDRLVNQLLKSNQPKDFQSLSGAFSGHFTARCVAKSIR